jgi:hypothetical protein
VQIRVANAARPEPNEHLSRPRRVELELFERKRTADLLENGCLRRMSHAARFYGSFRVWRKPPYG